MKHRRFLASRLDPLLPFLLVLVSVGALAAEKIGDVPPLVDRVRVEVVNVDVVVTDSKGIPVSGLGPDDFIVYEDGKERDVSNFFSFVNGRLRDIDDEAEEEETELSPNLGLRRRMAILFDTNTLDKRERDQAVESLERFILEQFDGTYEWCVIAYGDRLQMLQPFTSDKTTVLGSLGSLRNLQLPVKQARATDQTFTEHQLISSRVFARGRRQALDMPAPTGIGPEEFELRERMILGLQRFTETAAAMVESMRAFSALPGRKSMVLVSGAMDTLPGGPQLLGYGYPGVGGSDRTDPMLATINTQVLELHQIIIRTANASGFAIYPIAAEMGLQERAPFIDVAREGAASFNTVVSPSFAQIDVDSTPKIMATGTGGVHYTSRKYYKAFDDIDHRTANSYVLGFTTDHAPDGEYHRIKVKARNPALEVKYREGYLHMSQTDRLVEELATPLLFPKNRGDFEVEAQIHRPEEPEEAHTVTVAGVIPIDAVTLIPQGKNLVGRVFLFVAAYDGEGLMKKLVREYQDLRLQLEAGASFPPGATARFGLKVDELEPGDYTFTITVMDEVTERYGTGLEAATL